MPYTPPSHHSPASSAPTSPIVSRRSSLQNGEPRPSLPRSSSYLTRHRRTPSAVGAQHGPIAQPSPKTPGEDQGAMPMNSSSVRQSPPPVTGDRGMPQGAIISPPESSASSDDDELPHIRGRQLPNLKVKQLHDAISQIPQHRENSPDKPAAGDLMVLPSQVSAMHHSFSATVLDELAHTNRKISHVRSATEPTLILSKSADNSLTGSEEEETDEEMRKKPPMVRKKSGELVRPALRLSSRRRPSSMPGTPTFGKAVHFDSHLEHVRHFLQVDRPLAVSAGSSPVDNYDSDSEFPFSDNERSGSRSPPYEWELIISNFPVDTRFRKSLPVRLERVWLSPDQKCLTGSVAVANLAFQKSVVCRFTLDYWKTTSEVSAEYVAEIHPKETPQGHDRFQFTIKLSDLANLESKTLYFCIRYFTLGQEFWDNNNGLNFQLDFKKKMLPQNGKNFQGAVSLPVNHSLPRSTRRSNPSTVPRPKSVPMALDEFGDGSKLDFDQSIHDYLGETGTSRSLRLKGIKPNASLASDNLSSRLGTPSGQAFANRYDFGASLSAAVQAAKDSMSPSKPDGLYMKSNHKTFSPPQAPGAKKLIIRDSFPSARTQPGPTAVATPPPSSSNGSPNSALLASSSYEELVNKYCFFGSKQSSPQLRDGILKSGLDGVDDATLTRGSNSTNSSYEGSPRQDMVPHSGFGAQYQSFRPRDPNPYFPNSPPAIAIGASPAGSPPSTQTLDRAMSPLASHALGLPTSSQSSARSPSPASLVGSFSPFSHATPGTEIPYQHMQDRFPFTGADSHSATAIRG